LKIGEWVAERWQNGQLNAFICRDRRYFADIPRPDPSRVVFTPDVDIILLGPHTVFNTDFNLQLRKAAAVHEIIHAYIFRNHEYLNTKTQDAQNPIEAFNKRIEAKKEIDDLSEFVAGLVPYLLPTTRPVYGTVNPELEKFLVAIKDEPPSEILNLATQFKTKEELKSYLFKRNACYRIS
jgi:hypothetical protein